MPFQVVLTVADGSQDTVSKRFDLLGADYATAVTQADAIRTQLQALSAGSVVKMSLQENTTYAYVPNTTSKTSKASIVAQNVDGKKFSFVLPMPDDTIFGAQGTALFDVVDTAEAQSWLDAITDNASYSDGESGALTYVNSKRVE